MASTTAPVFLPAQQGRVVNRLLAPLPAPVITPWPAAAPVAATTVPIGPARSPYWQNRLDTLATEREALSTNQAQLLELQGVGHSVDGIGDRIAHFALPTQFTVTTQMSAADTALLTRGVAAAETLAGNSRPPADSCVAREDMSDLAFTIIARLTTLAARLMDRDDVTLDSVIGKLKAAENLRLIGDIETLLSGTPADAAATLLRRAVDVRPFEQWLQDGASQDDPRLYDELNSRAALLLATKCLVATQVDGVATDWPPPSVPTEPAVDKRAPRQGKRAA